MGKGRLIILSGPSCVGKSPLAKALAREHPELAEGLRPLVLHNSRAPRPGERDGEDYRFRSRDEIEALRGDERYRVREVRGDLQALDLERLEKDLEAGEVFFEGNPEVGGMLLDAVGEVLSVFMSPLSRGEIEAMGEPERHIDREAMVTEVMRRKLLRRTRRQKGEISLEALEDIERRAGHAWRELGRAHRFGRVLVNHDGEDSEHWDAFPLPIGEAGRALRAFVALLRGEEPPAGSIEEWPSELVEVSRR